MAKLNQDQIDSLINAGKPFVIARYLGSSNSEMMCKTKADPTKKENRVFVKHTFAGRGGMYLLQQWTNPGGIVKDGIVYDEKGARVVAPFTAKEDSEVLIVLDGMERDGVGFNIRGTVTELSKGALTSR